MQQLNISESTANASHSLQEFIQESKARLKVILEQLQWTEEDVEKSFNTNSIAAKANQKEHNDSTDEEPALPESCASWNSITLSAGELRKLVNDATVEIPQKFSDLQLNFTREQKLQIYEHVCARTQKCSEPVMVPALDEGNVSFAEIVAQKKREKKKRRRYRRTKPTHIEEVRGVVELQMQALQQYLESKAMQKRNQKCQKTVTDERDHSKDSRRYDLSKRTSKSIERQKYCQRQSKSSSREHRSERHKHKKRSRSHSRSYDKKRYRERNESRSSKKYKRRSRSRHRRRSGSRSRRSHSGSESQNRYRRRSGSRTHGSRHYDVASSSRKYSSHHSRHKNSAEKIIKYMNDAKRS